MLSIPPTKLLTKRQTVAPATITFIKTIILIIMKTATITETRTTKTTMTKTKTRTEKETTMRRR